MSGIEHVIGITGDDAMICRPLDRIGTPGTDRRITVNYGSHINFQHRLSEEDRHHKGVLWTRSLLGWAGALRMIKLSLCHRAVHIAAPVHAVPYGAASDTSHHGHFVIYDLAVTVRLASPPELPENAS